MEAQDSSRTSVLSVMHLERERTLELGHSCTGLSDSRLNWKDKWRVNKGGKGNGNGRIN